MLRFTTILLFSLLSFFGLSLQVSAQSKPTNLSVKLVNDMGYAIVNAKVELANNYGKILTAKSDANGFAHFPIDARSDYTKARIFILQDNGNRFEKPLNIGQRIKTITIEVDDMVIMDDGFSNPKNEPNQLDPTLNVIPTTSSAIQKKRFFTPDVRWGPYTPTCDANPLAGVLTFTPLSVEPENTLLDAFSSSCLGAFSDAVDAMVLATENVISMGIKLQALANVANNKQTTPLVKTVSNANKALNQLIEADNKKAQAALSDAYEKVSEMLDAIKALAAGPEMYVLKCFGEGITKYSMGADVSDKINKSREGFAKTKEEIGKKKDAIQKLLKSGKPITKADLSVFTNWDDAKEQAGATYKALSVLAAYASDPKKFLSYETLANMAISNAEKKITTLLTDCEIRAADLELKEGILAGQAALTASRKFAAQMKKEESKWNEKINKIVENFALKDRGWQLMKPNDYRLLSIQEPYNTWVKYHNTAIEADKASARIEGTLGKLTPLCNKVQTIATTLNRREEAYEQLYINGCLAATECDFEKAANIKIQMQKFENSTCSHFYPQPFGIPKSEELKGKIEMAKLGEKCKDDTEWAGTYEAPSNWGRVVVVISGSANGFTAATQHIKTSGYNDKGTWTGCIAEGNTLKCRWTEQYEDNDKKASRNGTNTITKTGETITISSLEEEPVFSYKNGITPYSSSMRKGAVWNWSATKK